MTNNSIFIAKRKSERTHVFLRVYQKSELENPDYAFDIASVDKLLLAQDPESFIDAVSEFYPLCLKPLCKRECIRRPRLVEVREFRANAQGFYGRVDGSLLIEEYTGLKDDGTEINKNSLKRAIEKHDAMRDENILQYLESNDFADTDLIVVEPVQDWTAAKAILSNLVLSQAYLTASAAGLNFDEVTTHNGYWVYGKPFDKRINERVKQFTYNSFWKTETAGELLADAFRRDSAFSANPLLSKYIRREVHALNVGADESWLRNSEHILLKTSPRISGEALSLFKKARKAVIDRSIYLTADARLDDETIAVDFIRAIVNTTRELTSEDEEPLGWEHDDVAAAINRANRATIFHSQWARLVYDTAIHEEGVKPTVCKHCGRPMLNHTGCKLRQFCRFSCKTKHCNERKSARNNSSAMPSDLPEPEQQCQKHPVNDGE